MDIPWKLRKGEQLFLCVTRRPHLTYIPIKLSEVILNGYRVMERTIMLADGRTVPCHNTTVLFFVFLFVFFCFVFFSKTGV